MEPRAGAVDRRSRFHRLQRVRVGAWRWLTVGWAFADRWLTVGCKLIQQRIDIDAQLAQIDQAERLAELEQAFVKVAASSSKRTGISAAALREVGVPAHVLRKAGL